MKDPGFILMKKMATTFYCGMAIFFAGTWAYGSTSIGEQNKKELQKAYLLLPPAALKTFHSDPLKIIQDSKAPVVSRSGRSQISIPTDFLINYQSALKVLSEIIDDRADSIVPEISHLVYCKHRGCDLPSRFSFTTDFLLNFDWHFSDSSDGIEPANFFFERSPDVSEFISPQKSFSIHFTLFLSDKNYACAFPSRYRYFKNIFLGFAPPNNPDCFNKLPVFISSGVGGRSRIKYYQTDHVLEAHYLWATPKGSGVSSAGHAMLRLIFCDLKSETANDCRKMPDRHLVVNYSGAVRDGSIQKLKGLTGKYPLVTTISTLPSILKQYSDYEFRETKSVPLNLSKEELAALFERAVEKSWTFEGRYFFLSRNCGTEFTISVRSAASSKFDLLSNLISPKTIFEYLIGSQTMRHEDFRLSQLSSTNSGLYFKSRELDYANVLRLLQTLGLFQGLSGLAQLNELSLSQWGHELATASNVLGPNRTIALSGLLQLLKLTKRIHDDNVNTDYLMTHLEVKEKQGPNSQNQALENFLQLIYQARNPSRLMTMKVSYGIPNPLEVKDLEQSMAKIMVEAASLKKELNDERSSTFPDEMTKIHGLQALIDQTQGMMKL